MPSISDRLRSLFGSRSNDASQTGVLRLGTSTFQAQTYTLPRIAASVYSNPTGYRCVELIANSLSRPAWEVYRHGTTDPIEKHPLLDVLDSPAPRISGTQLQAMMARDLTMTGRSALLKMQGRDGFGDKGPVTGLRRLSPFRLVVLGNQDDELVGFVYMDRQGVRLPILPDDVVYIHFPNPERYYDGIAPAVVAGLPAEIDSSAMRFNYDLLANDGALPGYIAIKGLVPDQFQEWVAAWQSKEVPGKMRFLGGSGEASYVKVGQTNQELAYDKLRDYSQKDICMAHGIAYVLLNPTDATFTNMTEARSGLWQDTLQPIIALENDQMTMQLGADFGVDVGQSLDGIDELQEATDAVVDRGIRLLGVQAYTINELRDDLGQEPLSWGDVPIAPAAPLKALPQGVVDPDAPQPLPGEEPDPPPVAVPPAPPVPPPKAPPPKAIAVGRVKSAAVPIANFDDRVVAWEKRMERRMRAFFGRQGRVVAARVRAGAGKNRAKALDGTVWWDKARWDGELAEDLAEIYTDIVDAFGTIAVSEIRQRAFNPRSPAIAAYIEAKVNRDSIYINLTTADEVRTLITEGEAAGLSIPDIAASIEGYFSGDESQAAMRAERVARTEVIGASNFGALQGAIDSGVVESKEWLGTDDNRECDECQGVDGEVVPLADMFSNGLDAPGAHPNCRCAIGFITTPTVDLTTPAEGALA